MNADGSGTYTSADGNTTDFDAPDSQDVALDGAFGGDSGGGDYGGDDYGGAGDVIDQADAQNVADGAVGGDSGGGDYGGDDYGGDDYGGTEQAPDDDDQVVG